MKSFFDSINYKKVFEHFIHKETTENLLEIVKTFQLYFKKIGKYCRANMRVEKGQTPLHMAVRGGRINSIKILLNTGLIDVNERDKAGGTILHAACDVDETYWISNLNLCSKEQLMETIKYLLDNAEELNLDVNAKNGKSRTNKSAIHNAHDMDMFKIFFEHPMVDIHSTDYFGFTVYSKSTYDLKRIDYILANSKQRGIDLNYTNSRGSGILFNTAFNQNAEGLKHLFQVASKYDINLNIVDEDGNTMLHAAIYSTIVRAKDTDNRYKTVKVILEHAKEVGFNVNHRNNAGETARELAKSLKQPRRFERLFKKFI